MNTQTQRLTSLANPFFVPQAVAAAGSWEPHLRNFIAIVADDSVSMQCIAKKAREVLNQQILNIRQQQYDTKQETLVTVVTFSDSSRIKAICEGYHPASVPMLDVFNYPMQGGSTALNDGVRFAIERLKQQDFGMSVRYDDSALVIVVTDGIENASRNGGVGGIVSELQRSGRWTFAYLVPPGHAINTARATGVHAGNIMEWEQTDKGVEKAGDFLNVGTQSYYAGRAKGVRSSSTFFTNMNNVDVKSVATKLSDVSKKFKRIPVTKEGEVADAVRKAVSNYQLGNAFFELTKPEKIAPHKELLVEHKPTKKVYGGSEARVLVGLPADPKGSTVRVKPGNHGDYKIYVQSTSMNRKLVRGTDVLYRVVS